MNDIINYEGNKPADLSMVQQLAKAEIDQQIATAHVYPRSLSKISKNVLSLVTISQNAAEKCTYALPRGGKPITGPSIRLAEIVASQWGNSRVGARVVHVDRKEMYVEAEGVFHDLETNTATTARVRRRISDRNGRLFNDDMIIVTGNAACSIAKRNAILGGVPEAIWGEAYDAALRTVRGDMKTLPERRDETLKAMAAFGLSADEVYQILGIAGEKDFGLDQISTLRSTYAGLKNGELTVEELLKTIEAESTSRKPGSITRDTASKKAEPEPSEEEEKQSAEVNRLRTVYEDLTGEKPDGRWGIPALTDNIEKAKATRLKRDADQNETDNAERQRMQAERDAAQETFYDPETGEVKEEPQPSANENVPSRAQLEASYNDIVNGLVAGLDPNSMADTYTFEIHQMRAVAPDLHTKLMAEFQAANE